MVELSSDQKLSLDSLMSWYTDPSRPQFITLGGYAGTGKTTLIAVLRQKLHKDFPKLKVAFCSYTGKAARVMLSSLVSQKAVLEKDSVGTIHSLMYSPVENDKHIIIGWKLRDKIEGDLIIVDEASMVDGQIWNDLLSFGKPIIAVGDHGQLPPIRGSFNLMADPELRLEKIHRQAEGNPIIKLSILAREEGHIPTKDYSYSVRKVSKSNEDTREFIEKLLTAYDDETLVLCGYNRTRVRLNNYIRSGLGFDSGFPMPNDRVICLRNNRMSEIYNGMLGRIKTIEEDSNDWYFAEINLDGEGKPFKGNISKVQFGELEPLNFTDRRASIMDGDLFDFGYAITVHKAQGSQAERVILFEERFSKMDDDNWRRWLYTGVTRAKRDLFIVGA